MNGYLVHHNVKCRSSSGFVFLDFMVSEMLEFKVDFISVFHWGMQLERALNTSHDSRSYFRVQNSCIFDIFSRLPVGGWLVKFQYYSLHLVKGISEESFKELKQDKFPCFCSINWRGVIDGQWSFHCKVSLTWKIALCWWERVVNFA